MDLPAIDAEAMNRWAAAPRPAGTRRFGFRAAAEWPEDDLVAIGGTLDVPTVLEGYRRGVFPMEVTELPGVLGWWSPNPRGIMPLDGLRVTRSMRQYAKRYEIRVDTSFDRVIRACANPKRPHGWITPEFIAAYAKLHELGWAHSIEAFDADGELAGGLYGVRVAQFFAGESMFHIKREASKIALMGLVDLMRNSGMTLLDVQWCTDHLASLGAIEIPREEYLRRLADAVGEAARGL